MKLSFILTNLSYIIMGILVQWITENKYTLTFEVIVTLKNDIN